MTLESDLRFDELVKRNKELQVIVVPCSKLRSSSISNSFFSTKLCSSCVQPLGLFISRGSCCPKCGLKVCKKCKIYEVHSPTWCCLACYKIMKHGRGGIVTSNNRDDVKAGGVKRSFSITETSRSSPVLKSYTKYYEDRPYNSLPRMTSNFHPGNVPREGGGHPHSHHHRGNILERKSSLFQSTLHPFRDIHDKKSPSSSVNFIEDEYWDYYDYEFNSNRSSCERSLGETVEYQHCVSEAPPRKPERRKCRSMGAFDAKYSQLKSFCVITTTKATGKDRDRGSYNSLPRKHKKIKEEFEKENLITFVSGAPSQTKSTAAINEHKANLNSQAKNVAPTNKGQKNRSIVKLEQDQNQHPQFRSERLAKNLNPSAAPKDLVPKATENCGQNPGQPGQLEAHNHKVNIPNSINVSIESTSDRNQIMQEPQPVSYKNNSVHSSLRKNKYLDFYNGFTNKPGSGLYFSLPPMRDRETPPSPKPNSINLGNERETQIPIFPKQNLSHAKIPLNEKYPNPNQNSSDPMENPYLILEHLKRKSEELEKVQLKPKTMINLDAKSSTLPKAKDKVMKDSVRTINSNAGGPIQTNSTIPIAATTNSRGSIPLFTAISTSLSPNQNVRSDSSLLFNKNNSSESVLTDRATPSSSYTNNSATSTNCCSSSAGIGVGGVREVIIVIEREFDSPSPNSLNALNFNSSTPNHKPHNDCHLIESRQTQQQQQQPSPLSNSNFDQVTGTPRLNNSHSLAKTGGAAAAANSSNLKLAENHDELTTTMETIAAAEKSFSSSSSTASTVLDLEEDPEDLGCCPLLFHDCLEIEEESDFKSCGEDEGIIVRKCSSSSHSGNLRLDLGGAEEQVQVQMQFSPGSSEYSSTLTNVSTTASASTSSTLKNEQLDIDVVEAQLLGEGEQEGLETQTKTTIINTTSTSPLLLSLAQQNVNESQNMLTTTISTTSPASTSVTITNNVRTTGASSSAARSAATTTKKFKSRVLVNADCDYDSDFSDGVTNVEIHGDQVGIVTGRGTFIRRSNSQELLLVPESEKVSKFNGNEGEGNKKGLGTKSNLQENSFTNENDIIQAYTSSGIGAQAQRTHQYNENTFHEIKYNEHYSQHDVGKFEMKSKSNTAVEKYLRSCKTDQSADNENDRMESLHDGNQTSKSTKSNMNSISRKEFRDSHFSCRRESPEGEEADLVNKTKFDGTNNDDDIDSQLVPRTRSSPDGADKSDDSSPTTPNNPIVEEPLDDEAENDDGESTDSWAEESAFEEDEKPPPLDLTLHTIVEESCEESEAEVEIPKPSKLNDLEKYYNFTMEEPVNYEESEFSDTFSESSLSFELRNSVELNGDHLLELETGRLEKYFLNLGLSNDSDSVGSESDSECSVLDNRKKVLKHHRRSAEFEDPQDVVTDEDDECAFEQDGLDTIKKQRKLRRSSEDLLDQLIVPVQQQTMPINMKSEFKENSEEPSESQSCQSESQSQTYLKPSKQSTPASVSRSNSFTWSSDEEVNLMMSKLRHLIKNMVHIKKVDEQKNDKLIYLENELVRLMKNENIKNIVESISSDSEDDVYKLFERVDGNQPELLNKVMTHIGKRLHSWMKDTDEFTDDGATIKCAPSISSDLNEDRFSWKGSFESTLAKRQSVGSSDSIDAGTSQEGNELFSERSILRSSSLHHLATSQPILEESEPLASSLPRLNDHPISSRRSNHGLANHQEIKSGRYRPPGYFENMETHVSTPILNTNFSTNKLQDGFHVSRKNFAVRGQIEFLMQYNYKCSTFELCIKQCRDLAAVDAKRGRSDPYVKVYLLPERAKSSKKKTKVKKNTLNPMFREVLKFPVPLEELQNRILWLTVYHSGLFGKNEFLGEVLLNLRNVTFEDVNYKWFPLQEQRPLENFPADDAEIKQNLVLSLALKWSPRTFNRGNLTILIKDAKGLKYIKNACPSTFVKCSPINEKSKKQKTPLCRKTLNPVWNTTLTFENITNEGIDLAFYNYDLLNHELISSAKLDPDCDVWREMGKREGFWVEGLVAFE